MIELTQNDIAFLQQLQKTSKHNMENTKRVKLKTKRGLLSKELLTLFEVETNTKGAWFMNVYVEFEPMFVEAPAENWQ